MSKNKDVTIAKNRVFTGGYPVDTPQLKINYMIPETRNTNHMDDLFGLMPTILSEDKIKDTTVNENANLDVGVKFDSGKPDPSLIPPEVIEELAKVLSFGAKKYAPRNWEKGINFSRVFASLNRHIWTWWDPTKPSVDPETGLSHLSHAACCIAFLLAYEGRGDQYDSFNDKPLDINGTRN